MKIGITQRVEVMPATGERRDCLDQAWVPLLCRWGFTPVPIPNSPENVESLVVNFELQGVLFSGGNDLAHLEGASNCAPERDETETQLLDLCRRLDLPTIGVCRGMQIMVFHHGGCVTPIEQHVGGRHSLKVSAHGVRLGLSDRREVNSFHNYGVLEENLGSELVPLAYAPDGSVEAVAHTTLNRVAILWHPERLPDDPRDRDLLSAVFLSEKSSKRRS